MQPIFTLPRARTAFLAALGIHFGLMWLGSRLPNSRGSSVAADDLTEAFDVSLLQDVAQTVTERSTPAVSSPGDNKPPPGGGAVDRDLAEASQANVATEPVPSPKPPQLAQKRATPNRQRPAPLPSEAKEQPTESLPAAVSDNVDLFALDALLEEADGSDAIAIRTRPEAIHTQVARSAAVSNFNQRPSKTNRRPSAARSFGMGKGSGSGSGGNGRGSGDGGGSFGGSDGNFRGQICFIEPGTKALRQLGACTVQGEFFTDLFNITPRSFTSGFPGVSDRSEWFAILYTGNLFASKSGSYRFRVVSDDGAILRIDGEVVVDNDGQHGPVWRAGLKSLDRGPHKFELRYFQGPRTMVALQVFVTPPDQPEQLLRRDL